MLSVIAVIGLGAAGCGASGSNEGATTTTTAPTTTTTAPSTTATTVAPPITARGLTFFRSPTGNISCTIDSEGARCDIKEHDWSPPPKPADCQLDWGNGLTVDASGSVDFVCAGDTTMDPRATVLAYGHSIQAASGAVSCTSQRDGMSCSHRASGHGFRVARGGYSIQ